jgi:site-specific recombinase XerD
MRNNMLYKAQLLLLNHLSEDLMAVAALSQLPTKAARKVGDILNQAEFAIHEVLVDRYRNRRIGTAGHAEASVKQALFLIKRLIQFAEKPIWKISEIEINNFFGYLALDLKRARSTRRAYQAHIKSFCLNMVIQRDMCEQIHAEFGVRPRQLINDETRIMHKIEYDGQRTRRAISRKHMGLIFDTLDRTIEAAYESGDKTYWTLCRDRAMIYVTYANGFRRDESANLTLGSFMENPLELRFRDYGTWYVVGKGRKSRPIESILPGIVTIMDWYLEDIRPKLLDGRTEVYALFLTEGGRPISGDVVYQAFKRVLKAAGLEGLHYCLHELRHTYTTMACALIGTKATQEQVGHTFQATTEGYNHVPAKEKGRQLAKAVDRMFKQRNKGE